jgi:hypothetical protein
VQSDVEMIDFSSCSQASPLSFVSDTTPKIDLDRYTLEVGNGTRTTIVGLRPSVIYVFEVQAHNVHGESDYSTIRVNTTAIPGE